MGKAMATSGAPAAVHVVAMSRVVPARVPPVYAGHLKLSFLDAPWVATPPVKLVFMYELASSDEFSTVVRRLKDSLAATLALYLPLAGKLALIAETGDVVVDYSDAGVAFLEAESMDVRLLAGDAKACDVQMLFALLPEHDARVLNAAPPVLCVQATRIGSGHGKGVALGVSWHHAVADGHGMALFLDAWGYACRTGSPVATSFGALEHGREAIVRVHPGGNIIACEVLNKVAPDLPVTSSPESYFSFGHSRLAQRTFHVDANNIRSLKRHVGGQASAEASKPVPTFVALSALCWTAFVRVKGLAAGDDTHLIFWMDIRDRLRPRVGAGYTGNCVRGCLVSADAGELIGETGLLRASQAIQAAVREVNAAPLAGMEEWIERVSRLPRARVMQVAGSPLFRVYEMIDFCFGRPSCVEPVSMGGNPLFPMADAVVEHELENLEGRMVLNAGMRHGEVQVSVSLDPMRVDAFMAHIYTNPRPKI